MRKLGGLLGCVVVAGLAAVSVRAEAAGTLDTSASCAFGDCSAQLTSTQLQISCDGKSVYSGAFELTTDFQTTKIVPQGSTTQQITVQGMPTATAPASATLTLSDRTVTGTCSFAAN